MIQKLLDERKLPALMKMNDGTPVTKEKSLSSTTIP